MYFNSYLFILLFLPLVVVAYFLVNKKSLTAGKWLLLIASLVFYAMYSIWMLLILLVSVAVNYCIYLYSSKATKRKAALIIAIVLNCAFLFVFKYATLFIGEDVSIIVPVGISFYTFSQISFQVDSYRNAFSCNFLDYLSYVTFFPKVLSGPFMKADDYIEQLNDPSKKTVCWENVALGIFCFSIGLAKKVLLADFFATLTDSCYSSVAACSGAEALSAIITYPLQLYFDFSGYSEMALGVGLMLNFSLPINFKSPYKADGNVDFWKRWHISLTGFLTEYIYFPLGGSRKGKPRQYLNILIVFLVSGIWHGAGLTFVVWGLIHGVLNILSRLLGGVRKHVPKVVRILVSDLCIVVAWVFFRASTISDAITMITKPFTTAFGTINADLQESLLQPTIFNVLSQVLGFNIAWIVVIAACICLVLFARNVEERNKRFKPNTLTLLVSVILICLSVFSLTHFSSFIYGGF